METLLDFKAIFSFPVEEIKSSTFSDFLSEIQRIVRESSGSDGK